jgi:hypothetical protein
MKGQLLTTVHRRLDLAVAGTIAAATGAMASMAFAAEPVGSRRTGNDNVGEGRRIYCIMTMPCPHRPGEICPIPIL